HHLDQRVLGGPVGEAHLIADGGAQLDPQLLADPLGDRPGSDPAGLRMADGALDAPAQLEADLGQLGRLAGAGLPRDDHDLVVADGLGDVAAALGDRQLGRVADLGRQRGAAGGCALGPAVRVLLRPVAALLAAALVATIRLFAPLAASLLVAGTLTWAGVLAGHEGYRHKSGTEMHTGSGAD